MHVERRPLRWRFYETVAGTKPVRAFLDGLPRGEAAEIVAAMKEVTSRGLNVARHLRGDLWEVRIEGDNRAYRVVFSPEGRFHQVLLALAAFTKKTERTPPRTIRLAESRLADWRNRGAGR